MKKAAILILLLAVLGCEKKEHPILQLHNTILILKVDFQTYQFEGAKEVVISDVFAPTDTIPLNYLFKAPSDFGYMKIWHEPGLDTLFYGDVVWNGWGPLHYPQVDPAASFSRTSAALPAPDSTHYNYIWKPHNRPPVSFDSLWMDLADLDIVQDYYHGSKKFSYFCYTPSVGFGDPSEWDYYIFMNALK